MHAYSDRDFSVRVKQKATFTKRKAKQKVLQLINMHENS